MPEAALEINEPAAVLALGRIQRSTVPLEGVGDVATTFWRTDKYALESSPKICLLHGADSNSFEWRYVAEKLGANGLDCTAVDWWSGGFTDREPITRALVDSGGELKPWTLVREHLNAFFRQQFFAPEVGKPGEQVVLIGASLGGAVAIDYAAAHPDRVKALILIDAGGESYKAPSADAVKALAPAVLAVKSFAAWITAKVDQTEEARINGLHRTEPGWSEAYGAYLASGGYQASVTPELIRTLTVPTLVIWGADDPILPLSDAYAFERDLGSSCYGVREVSGAGHSPHLDDPVAVTKHVSAFLEELGLTSGARTDEDAVAKRRQYREGRPPTG